MPKVNAAVAAALAQPRAPLEPTPFCQAKARDVAIEGGGKPVGSGRLARAAGDRGAFRASPEIDGDTLALAAGLVDEMKLGRGTDPDLLAISLSATDYVGHAYGTEGEEMCLQLTELDREIGDFLKVLDSRGIDYAVALTADHGGKDVPERERLAGVSDAARMNASLAPAMMGKALVARLGLGGPGLLGDSPHGDIYIDAHLEPARPGAPACTPRSPPTRPIRRSRRCSPPARSRALPCRPATRSSWTLIQRARASYLPGPLGRFRRGPQEATSRRSPTPAATSRPTARPGITTAACRSCSGGRAHRR